MVEKRKVVFYGNGLNQVSGGINWNELLKNMKGKTKVPHLDSNTMYFEMIYFARMESKLSTNIEVRKDVVDEMISMHKSNQSKQRNPEIYEKLACLPVADYITTNYDLSLEFELNSQGYNCVEEKIDHSEITYSVHRYNKFCKGDVVKRIWHIHGDIGNFMWLDHKEKKYKSVKSIMLGYEHYCNELSRIVNYVRGHYEGLKVGIPAMSERMEAGLNGRNVMSWVDHFFVSDIHFIGYSMDFSEIDVWWLLNKRMRMKWEDKKIQLQNDIIFHCYDGSKPMGSGVSKACCGRMHDVHKDRIDVLKSFGVKIASDKCSDNYESHYGKVLDDIKDNQM